LVDIDPLANLVLASVAVIGLVFEIVWRRREDKRSEKQLELLAKRLKQELDLANRKLEALQDQNQKRSFVEQEKVNVQKRKQSLAEAKALGGAFNWFLDLFSQSDDD
jgi:hypothetical protein